MVGGESLKYSLHINQLRAVEWDLNPSEAIVFGWLFGLPSWAETITLEDGVYSWAAPSLFVADLPLISSKEDTFYRLLKSLIGKGLVKKFKYERRDYWQITTKGKAWEDRDMIAGNKSEEFGNKSGNSGNKSDVTGNKSDKDRKNIRKGSENFPTDTYTSNTYNNINLSAFAGSIQVQSIIDFIDYRTTGKSELTQLAFDRAMQGASDGETIGLTPEEVIAKVILLGAKSVNLADLKKQNLVEGTKDLFFDGEFYTLKKLRWTDADMTASGYMAKHVAKITGREDVIAEATLNQWAHEIRVFREQESMGPRQILEPFLWSTTDRFWKTKIQDPKALRNNINKLLAEYRASKGIDSAAPAKERVAPVFTKKERAPMPENLRSPS